MAERRRGVAEGLEEEGSLLSDYGRLFQAGAQSVGSGLASLGAQMQERADRAITGRRGAAVRAEGLRSLAQRLAADADASRARVSEQTRSAQANLLREDANIFRGENPINEFSLRGAGALVAETAPSLVASILPALVGRRFGGQRAGDVAGAASAGAVAAGAAGSEERARVEQMAPEQLAGLESYRRWIAEGLSPEDARAEAALAAEGGGSLGAGVVAGLGGAATSRILGSAGDRLGRAVGGGRVGRAAAVGAVGGIEEGVQEAGEGIAQRFGGSTAAGEQGRDITEGSAANFAAGVIAGGPTQAVIAAAQPAPPATVQPERGPISRATAKGIEAGAVAGAVVAPLVPAAQGAPVIDNPALPTREPAQIEAAAPGFQSGDGAIAFDAPPSAPIEPAKASKWKVGEAEIVNFPGLTPEQRQVEARAWAQVIAAPDDQVAAYRKLPGTDGGRIVNTDEARELFPDYNAGPEARSLNAAAVHEPSSIIAKRVLAENLAAEPSGPDAFVLFTGGGTGAGKTTGIKRMPELKDAYDMADFIFDGNLQNAERAAAQIERVKSSGRKAHIIYTFRDPIQAWRSGTLPRASREDYGRTVPANVQAATHVGAAKAAMQLLNQYANDPDVKIDMVYNSYDIDDKANSYVRPATMEDIQAIASLDEAALTQELENVIEEEYAAGRIPERVYRGSRAPAAQEGGRVQQGQGLDAAAVPGREADPDQGRLSRGSVGRAAGMVDDAARAAAAPAADAQPGSAVAPAGGAAVVGADGRPAVQQGLPAEASGPGGRVGGAPASAAAGAAVGIGAAEQGVGGGLPGQVPSPAAPVVPAPGGAGQQQQEVIREGQVEGADAVPGQGSAGQAAGQEAQVAPDGRPQFLGAADGSRRAARPVSRDELSTRKPTAKKATEDPLADILVVGLESSKMDRRAFEKNVELITRYPNYREAASANTPDKKVERFINHVRDNLLWLHDQMNPEIRQRTKLWYDGANAIANRWAQKYNITVAEAGGVLAVLSPQKDWFMNVSLAERVLDTMINRSSERWSAEMTETADRIFPSDNRAYAKLRDIVDGKTLDELQADDERAMWIRVYDQTYNSPAHPVVTPEGNVGGPRLTQTGAEYRIAWNSISEIAKAVSIIRDNSLENISEMMGGQHKVRNFYNNIVSPNSPLGHVTIDTHAVAAGLLRPLSSASAEVAHNFGEGGSGGSSIYGSNGTYGLYAEAYRRAAKERGILPREMQSIAWEEIRGIFSPRFKARQKNIDEVDAAWNDFRKGKASYESTRQRILQLAGGAADPDWHGPGPGRDDSPERAAFVRMVAGDQLPGRAAADGRGVPAIGARGVPQGGGEFLGAAAGDGGRRDQARGAPSRASAPLPGAPRVKGAAGPDPRLVEVAERYARANGITLRRQARYAKVDPERAARIAAAYAEMEHAPSDPRVQAAYAELIRQTIAQYRALEEAGYRFWFSDPDNDPYQGNPWNAMRDLRATQSMAVFPTDAGFGSGVTDLDVSQNPLLADTGIRWPYGSPDGELRPVMANDLFRAVHDAFGHGLEGAGFRADGEENAWQAHVRLFTGDAIGAITSETRGQNSWLNFGPYGEQNRSASVGDTVFADQKTGLMPEWTWIEGRVESEAGVDRRDQFKAPASVRTSRTYAEMGGDEKKATQRALRALQRAGFPKSWIDRIPSFFTHNPTESFGARFYMYGEMKGSVSIRADQFNDNDRMMRNLAHELAHAADYDHQVEGFYSESSPLFAISENNGKMSFDGEIIKELHSAWVSDTGIAYELAYPFSDRYGMDAKTVKVEAFAQAVMLYFTDRTEFKKAAPKSFAMVERIVNNEKQGERADKAGRSVAQGGNGGVQSALRVSGAREFNPRSAAQRDGARNQVEPEGGQDQAGARGGEQRLGDGAVTDTPEFKRWFGDSKVVDANGKPLVVYHGTSLKNLAGILKNGLSPRRKKNHKESGDYVYVELSAKAARAWARQAGGREFAVLEIEIPKGELATDSQTLSRTSFRTGRIPKSRIKGWDVYQIDPKTGDLEYVRSEGNPAFRPEQIKSAIGNRGTFDPGDPSILGRADRREFLGRDPPAPAQAFEGFTLPSWDLRQHLQQQASGRIAAYKDAAAAGAERLRVAMQDYFLPVRRVQEAIERTGKQVAEAEDVYGREELYYGRTGEQLRQLEIDHVKPLVKAMVDAGVEQADLELYLYAKFAPQRNARIASIREDMPDGGSGMTNADAAQILADFKASGMTGKLEQLAKRVRDLNRLRLQVLEEGGLLSAEEAELWRSEPDYVPLKGVADTSPDEEPTLLRTGGGFSIGGREAHRALGRRSRASDILANTIAQTEQAIIRAEKNRVAQALYRLVKANPNEAMWEVDATEVKPAFDRSTGEVVYRRVNEPNAVMVKVDGKEHRIVLRDPRLVEAMRNLGSAKTGAFLRAFASINRFLSLTRTMLAPEFVLANFARDIQTAAVNLTGERSAKMAAKVANPSAIGAAMRAMWRQARGESGGGRWQMLARQFAEDGGMTAFVGQQTVEEQQDRIQSLLAEAKGGAPAAIRKLVRGTFDFIADANLAVENAVRLSAYSAALDEGMSRQQAARLAKNLTVNFNRKGQVGPVANSLYLFYNASIQGMQRFLRAMRSPTVQGIMASTAVIGYTMAMWNRAMAGEDDDGEDKWDKIPDWEKGRNLIILRPDGNTIKIPLPYSYNLPFVIGQQIEAMVNGRKNPLQGSLAVAETVLTSFSPFGDIDLQGDSAIAATKLVAPTAVDPFVDIAVNRNFFGAPINPERSPFDKVKDPDSAMAFPSVNPGVAWLAKTLNRLSGGDDLRPGLIDVSPGSMVYIFDYLTGGTGGFVERTATAAMLAASGKEVPTAKIPFVRVFAGELSDRRATDTFYRVRDDVNLKLEMGKTQGYVDPEDRRDIAIGKRMAPMLRTTERQLKALRDRRKKAQAEGNDDLVERIKEREIALQTAFNRRYFSLMYRQAS